MQLGRRWVVATVRFLNDLIGRESQTLSGQINLFAGLVLMTVAVPAAIESIVSHDSRTTLVVAGVIALVPGFWWLCMHLVLGDELRITAGARRD